MVRKLSHSMAAAAMRNHGAWPIEPYPGSAKRWKCICMTCGELLTTPTYSNVVSKKQGACDKECKERKGKAAAGNLRIAEAAAISAMKSYGAWPIEPYVNNRTQWQCVCMTCGELINPTYQNVVVRRTGPCNKTCKGRNISKAKKGDSVEATEVMHAAGLEPLVDFPGASQPWPVRCKRCGFDEGVPTLSRVKRVGHVCKNCGQLRTAASRRLSDREAEASMLRANLQPDVPYPGSVNIPWPCTCLRCGKSVRPGPRLGGIRAGHGGCSNSQCVSWGLRLDLPGYLYLIVNRSLHLLKWGIANIENRLKEHYRHGWHLVNRWDFSAAGEAEVIESQVMAWVRDQGVLPGATREQMPQKGHTETASLDEISLAKIHIYIEDLIFGPEELEFYAETGLT